MISCSGCSPTRSSTSCWRIDSVVRPGFEDPLASHRRARRGRVRACLLLRAERRRPGVHPEDLLPARAAGDRRAVRVRGRRRVRDPVPALGRPDARSALLRRHPPVADPRGRRADHRLDLGARLLGPLVGVGRADAGLVPDRVPALRVLPAAAVLDRGSGAPGALRGRVLDRGGRVRATELHGRAGGAVARAPARADDDRRLDAGLDAAHVPDLAGRDDVPVRDAVELRAGVQARVDAAAATQAQARRRRGRLDPQPAPLGGAAAVMPALPLDEAGKYVAGAYLVFLALVLIYVAIMASKLSRIERELGELNEIVDRRRAEEDDREPVARRTSGWWGARPTRRRRWRCASGWRCSTGRSSRSCTSCWL